MGDGPPSSPAPAAPGSAAALFAIVWDALVDVLGCAATAALITRSARLASTGRPALAALRVERIGFEYRYRLPERWNTTDPGALDALRALARSLHALLDGLTGSVVTRRLRGIPELRDARIDFDEESP